MVALAGSTIGLKLFSWPVPDRRERGRDLLHRESKKDFWRQEWRRGIRQPGGRQSPHMDGDPDVASRRGGLVDHNPGDLIKIVSPQLYSD